VLQSRPRHSVRAPGCKLYHRVRVRPTSHTEAPAAARRRRSRLIFVAPSHLRGSDQLAIIAKGPEQLVRRDERGCDPRAGTSRARHDQLAIDPLRDAQALAGLVENLKALLSLERQLVDAWNATLYETSTAGTAARRLLALKQLDRL
jgi:hypothetical protein